MATSAIRSQTAAGGEAVVITGTDNVRYYVSIYNGGTIRATPASNGRVNLIVDGSNSGSLLEINRIVAGVRNNNGAHTFRSQGTAASRLNIASITISSGFIGAIEGYQTANLSGPIVVTNATRVDRIAFSSILPGGSISVAGDLNTLDVYRDVTLSGASISIGRDLNWFQTYGNVTLTNGGNFLVGRDVGETVQPAKGSGNAGQGIYIAGNLTINTGSNFAVARNIPIVTGVTGAGVVVLGNFNGLSRFFVAGGTEFNPPVNHNFANVTFAGTFSP